MMESRLLGGRYQLGEVLGYGGMAEVHRGRDDRLGRDVAIKVLRTDLARDAGFQARFRREAQNAAALNHPAIVAVYDTGEEPLADGNLPYIVMEYVEGRTLKEVMNDEGPFMPQRALEIVADVCAALEFSHRHGIVHRDIKPGNVMLNRNGAVKVMDFGIARAVTSATATMTQTSMVIGTAQYLSPEQARGEMVDARSDVYSTGCLLYELLVGHPPFTGDNPVSVAYQHVREDPIPPSDINRELTPEIDAVVLKAMAKNPANRYQSANDMRSDLLRAAAGRAVTAPMVMSQEERTHLLPRDTGTARVSSTGPIPIDPLPDEPRRNNKALTYSLVALGLIVVFAFAAFITAQLLGDDAPQVSVPSTIGKDGNAARVQLEERGFKVIRKGVKSDAANKDKVVSQDPRSGEADKGSTVTIQVGQGPNTVPVPDLDGLTRDVAEDKLRQANLTADFQEVASSKPEGDVVDYDPKDTEVAEGSKVTVKISNGNLKEVPNVKDDTEAAAKAKLVDAGFKLTSIVVTYQPSDTAEPGTVVAQTPTPGQEKPSNTTITLTVARDIPSPGEQTTPTPTPTRTVPAPTTAVPPSTVTIPTSPLLPRP